MLESRIKGSLALGHEFGHLDLEAFVETVAEEADGLYLLPVLGVGGHHGFLGEGGSTSREVKSQSILSVESR